MSIDLGPEDIVLSDDLICDRLSADMLFRLARVDWAIQVGRRRKALNECLTMIKEMGLDQQKH